MNLVRTVILRWKRHPVRGALFGLALLPALNIGRYVLWPPVGQLATVNPPFTAMMEHRREQWDRDRAKQRKAPKDMPMRQIWMPLERISPHLRKAVVISEDDTFWEHNGFNFTTMQNALERNLKKGRMAAGGSTITQQLAKNLWFTPERSIMRKIKEAVMACRLELLLNKERILELYLNVAEWGNGIYGAEAAARHYFGKSAAALTTYEAASMAAILPAPLKRTPSPPLVRRLAARLVKRIPLY